MNKIKSNVPDCCKVQRNLHIAHCPLCKRKGGPVTQTTIDSLVVEERKRELESIVGFRFCTTPSCELAYFNSKTGEQIAKTMVRVPIGIKEGSSPRQICYCFNHSQESIEKEIQTTGESSAPAQIMEQCRLGRERCAELNPKGCCCLGDINKAIYQLKLKLKEA